MARIPKDPVNNSDRYIQYAQMNNPSSGQSCFVLMARYETPNNVPKCYDVNVDGYLTTSDYTAMYNQSYANPSEGNSKYNGTLDYDSNGQVRMNIDYTNYLYPLMISAADAFNYCWVCGGN